MRCCPGAGKWVSGIASEATAAAAAVDVSFNAVLVVVVVLKNSMYWFEIEDFAKFTKSEMLSRYWYNSVDDNPMRIAMMIWKNFM